MRWKAAIVVSALALVSLGGCAEDATPAPTTQKLRVSLFGWGPGDTGEPTFVRGMPAYEGAAAVRVRVTSPGEGIVLEEESGAISDRAVRIPEVPFARGLRLEMDVLNGGGEVLAAGATPQFDFTRGDASRELRMMIMPVNAFAQAGSVVRDGAGQEVFEQSRLDYRSAFDLQEDTDAIWLGRVGHVAAATADGRVLIVGGADVIPGSAPGSIPEFNTVHGDVQLFDPRTGYFSDLSYDESAQGVRINGADRLSDARAFHTVTPLGQDRFLVAGGYTKLSDIERPVRSLELIDLNRPAGERVTQVGDGLGNPIQTRAPRGFHKSVYLEEAGLLLMIGGIGETSDEILNDVEVVDIVNLRVLEQRFEMGEARTDHQAVKLQDGSVWIMGGRNTQGVLASTEILTPSGSGFNIKSGPKLGQPRYKFSAARLQGSDGTRVIALGGFTTLAGDPTATYEIGVKGLPDFVTGTTWGFSKARGGQEMLVLPQTKDLLIFGGRDASGKTVSDVERLSFVSLETSPPYALLEADLGSFVQDRFNATYTLMSSGQVLVMGGEGVVKGRTLALDSAELYNPRDPFPAQ